MHACPKLISLWRSSHGGSPCKEATLVRFYLYLEFFLYCEEHKFRFGDDVYIFQGRQVTCGTRVDSGAEAFQLRAVRPLREIAVVCQSCTSGNRTMIHLMRNSHEL